MNRFLLLAVLLLISPAIAAQIDFQDAEDVDDRTITFASTTGMSPSSWWVRSGNGGNSYACTQFYPGTTAERGAGIGYNVATPTTYAAGTLVSKGNATNYCPSILLFDGSYNLLAFMGGDSMDRTVCTANTRYEVGVVGTTASLYLNGTLRETKTITQNPSFVTFGVSNSEHGAASGGAYYMCWDDIVYGTSEDKLVVGFPEENIYQIKRDLVNPSANGFYYKTNGTLISSTAFTSTFGWSNTTGLYTIPSNETLYMRNIHDLTTYQTRYTGNNALGTISWNVTAFLETAAPYGYYQAVWANGTVASASGRIEYVGGGAVVAFDKDDYSAGENATITYTVEPDYWTLISSPRIVIVDIYGNEVFSESLVTNLGSVDYTWQEDDQGVYYAEVIGTYESAELILNIDWCEVAGTFQIYGYVNAAQTALPIEASNVTYTQGSTIVTASSGFNGNYSVSGFLTGIPIWSNVSADGYETQNFTFTVSNGHTITRNITLNETSPSYTGLGIGGVARDGVFTSPNTITTGYGRPISSPVCYLLNTTHSESYTTTGNNAGGYLFDETTPAILTTGRVYDLWCSRSGYANSPNYTVVAA